MTDGPREERGFVQVPVAGMTLLAVVILITVGCLLMGKTAETWDSHVRHGLEEDLIFRGEEYKHGIEEFLRVNGRLPMKLEELCPKEKSDVRYMRRCWLDPINNKEFKLLTLAEILERQQAAMLKALGEEGELGDGGSGSGSGSSGRGGKSGAGESGPESRRERQGPRSSEIQFSLPGQASKIEMSEDQPFQGVASQSPLTSFRSYKGATVYSEWDFVAEVGAGMGQPGGPGMAAIPGMPPGSGGAFGGSGGQLGSGGPFGGASGQTGGASSGGTFGGAGGSGGGNRPPGRTTPRPFPTPRR